MRELVARGRKFTRYHDTNDPPNRFITEISAADQHYLDNDEWKPINESWHSSEDANYPLVADQLNHKIEAGTGGERRWYPRREVETEFLSLGRPEYYSKNGKWTNLSINGYSVEGNTITLNTNQDITLLIHSNWNGVKVDYILENENAPTRFRFPVGITNLTYADGKLYGTDGEMVAVLTSTVAWDANEETIPASGTYDGQYVDFSVDTTDAVYPVTLDPDFSGDTADGRIWGRDASYSTARSTYNSFDNGVVFLQIGQTHKLDSQEITSTSSVEISTLVEYHPVDVHPDRIYLICHETREAIIESEERVYKILLEE